MQKTEKNFCNKCRQFTNHSFLHKEERSETEEIDYNYVINSFDGYDLLSCLGCEHVHLRHTQKYSENNGEEHITQSRYPALMARSKPRWVGLVFDSPFWTGDTYIEKTLEEIYIALSNKCPQLAGMGIRALLEFIMIDKVKDQGGFQKNLDAFCSSGHITLAQKQRLSDVLEVGHATMHRQYIPNMSDLNTSLDIVELLIENIYVHEGKAESMRKRIPPRSK